MKDSLRFNRAAILQCIPQGDPFVFLDSAVLGDKEIFGDYLITGEECFMAGHFPERPVFPASIMVEALGQLAIMYMLQMDRDDQIDPTSIYFIKSEDVQCRRKCLPGDCLEMSIRERRVRAPLMTFSGEIKVNGEIAVKVSSMALSFAKVNN